MLVGNRWKNAVGSARITVNLPAQTTGEQFITLDPIVPKFDGKKLTWLWESLQPRSRPGRHVYSPLRLADPLDRNAATAAQNPDDANAHLALGTRLSTARLARFAAPRQFPRPSRRRARNRRAPRTRQCGCRQNARAICTNSAQVRPNGPRDVNYVSLAMDQWQKLIGTAGDADARKQLGEDSFYLALDAYTRGEYDRALEILGRCAEFRARRRGSALYPRPSRQSNQTHPRRRRPRRHSKWRNLQRARACPRRVRR